MWEPVAHAHAITSCHVTSGDVTSGSTTSHHLKCNFDCADILLTDMGHLVQS